MKFSTVNYKKIEKESNSLRIDADFFRPDYLLIQKLLKKSHFKELKEYGIKIKHPTEIKREYSENGVLFLRAQNVRPMQIDLQNNPVFISKQDADILKSNLILNKDILLTRTGANFGQCAIYLNEQRAIASSHTFIIKSGQLNPYFLTVFFNTNFGRKLIDKGMYGGSQPEVAPFFLYQIPLPIFKFIPDLIEKVYLLSQKYIKSSENLNSQAEKLLLEELGLFDWKPKHELVFVKKFSDTQKSERFDSEYFQPFYDEIDNKLAKFEQKNLGDLCSQINYGTVPTSPYVEAGTPYIKGMNLIDGFVSDPFDYLENTEKLPKKFYTQKNDIIISQMGTVGKAGIVTKKEEGFLFASFTIRARLKNEDYINPYVLNLYINTVARPYYLMRKIAQASVRQNTDLPTINALTVPKFNDRLQRDISGKIIEAKKSKLLSKSLLEIAKKGVEMAIEKDEAIAEKWINDQVTSLKIDE